MPLRAIQSVVSPISMPPKDISSNLSIPKGIFTGFSVIVAASMRLSSIRCWKPPKTDWKPPDLERKDISNILWDSSALTRIASSFFPSSYKSCTFLERSSNSVSLTKDCNWSIAISLSIKAAFFISFAASCTTSSSHNF